ncbi:hypothetical protein [Rhodococcus artemisiae]|uniref:Mce-associated membrane protein n=1 Tax=Rhodococcus artemisiae TaxID=714159 RepID=A0ABU7LAJ5_9NOCA|nr:hypothetical protein [Rhodococcus artemisiae]MEE2058561.1 hypothetical protein [Rhodococcus artemisiae]
MSTTASLDEKNNDTNSRDGAADPGRRGDRLRRQVSLSSVVAGLVMIALAACSVAFAGLYFSARSTIDASDRSAHAREQAEQIATDYAVGAATTDYRDIQGWFDRLGNNTSPQLAAKFEATAPSLQQILVPLNWVSAASPITAKVRSESDGVYTVDAFVSVSSTSTQAPEGATSTVTYSITLDSTADWMITDVGGIDGGALPN